MPAADVMKAMELASEWESAHSPPKPGNGRGKLFLLMFLLPGFLAAGLPGRQRSFHYFYRAFTWITILLVLLAPLFALLCQSPLSQVANAALVKALGWAFGFTLALLYADKRCSMPDWSFLDGLMITATAFDSAGASISGSARVVLTVPLLVVVMLLSVVISLFNDIAARTALSPVQFQSLITFVAKRRSE